MKITCHCLVKNEENFIWYALNSVIDYVDEILVWDTGSSDMTIKIIKSIKSSKIKFKEIGSVDSKQLVEARRKMVEETNADWIFLLDGDEVWHTENIKNITTKLKQLRGKDLVVTPNKMLIGDMYHTLEEKAGQYKFYDIMGHYNIRFIRNFPGLNVRGEYPNEYYCDNSGTPIQNFPKEKILFDDNFYLHTSFLPRSSKDRKKIKYEIGEELPLDYYYPEVFFVNKPDTIYMPWKVMAHEYTQKAKISTPFKKLKRRFR